MAERRTLPVLPLRGTVIFPGITVPIGVGRPGTLRAIETALKGDHLIYDRRTGNFQSPSGTKGIYGVTVRVGLGEEAPHIESFGNIRKDQKTGQATVQEIREPVIDVFDEKDHVLIVAEMPGISVEDVQIEVKEDLLTISAAKGEKKYRKEVLLPRSFKEEKISLTCNNGVLEIKCLK